MRPGDQARAVMGHGGHDIALTLGPLADEECRGREIASKYLRSSSRGGHFEVVGRHGSVSVLKSCLESERDDDRPGDFPRPPFIGDQLVSTSTPLISEIEVSLGKVIGGSLGIAGRRASLASQVTVWGLRLQVTSIFC